MNRFEVCAFPQGDNAEVFPEIVVAVEEDRQAAARKAWSLQRGTGGDVCLYGIRRELSPDPVE